MKKLALILVAALAVESAIGCSNTQSSRRPSSVQFEDIGKARESMTQAQYDAYVRALRGQTVYWTGYVLDVEESGYPRGSSGVYTVTVVMDKKQLDAGLLALVLGGAVRLEISNPEALRLNKRQRIRFMGVLQSIDTDIGVVHLRSGKIK